MKKNILALPKDFNEYFDNLSVENKISIVKYIHENFEYDAVKKEEYLYTYAYGYRWKCRFSVVNNYY